MVRGIPLRKFSISWLFTKVERRDGSKFSLQNVKLLPAGNMLESATEDSTSLFKFCQLRTQFDQTNWLASTVGKGTWVLFCYAIPSQFVACWGNSQLRLTHLTAPTLTILEKKSQFVANLNWRWAASQTRWSQISILERKKKDFNLHFKIAIQGFSVQTTKADLKSVL